jgi:hypothetical protein
MREKVSNLSPCVLCIAFNNVRPCYITIKPCNLLTTRKECGGTYQAMAAFLRKGGDWKLINHIRIG